MQNFVLIGNGGIGSNICVNLMKLISYHKNNGTIKDNITLKICDGDTVEIKNAIRQDFMVSDNGKKKTDVTTKYVKSMSTGIANNTINIVSYPYYVKPDNIESVIQEGDIVLVGVDNYVTRYLIEEHTKSLNKVFVVYGGNDYDDGDVNVLIKENGKYITPLLTDKHPEVKERIEKYPDEVSCEVATPSSPQLIIANLSAGLYMLEAVNSYITENKVNWHEKFYDNRTGAVRVLEIENVHI